MPERGITHGGGEFFRFGDFELNRARWPEGWDTWKRIADRLHTAGLLVQLAGKHGPERLEMACKKALV